MLFCIHVIGSYELSERDLDPLHPITTSFRPHPDSNRCFIVTVDVESYDALRSFIASRSEKLWTENRIDWIVRPEPPSSLRLLITDMDSTIIHNECIDEIADRMGLKERVAAITEAAMNGRIDFASALKERVAMLKGLPVSALQEVYDERVRLTPGAEPLLAKARDLGMTCVLVSGGFTFFTEKIASRLGFHHHHANVLEIENDRLTGRVIGPIIDKTAKKNWLEQHRTRLGIGNREIIAIGDGANDIPMLQEAGVGVAFHAKEAVNRAVLSRLRWNDLSAIRLAL